MYCLNLLLHVLYFLLHKCKLIFLGGSIQRRCLYPDICFCAQKIQYTYYTDTDVKTGKNSTYQELDLSREDIPYQNTQYDD